MEVPKEYDAKIAEPKWKRYWEEKHIYKFDPDSKSEVYSVDTPPPTVSGRMHVGHACSYSQQDFIIRFHRMRGKNVFYPFGTDDNGLATERLVEKSKGVKSKDMSREEFVKLCEEFLDDELPKFVQDWKDLGISCDFNIYYSTIDEHCRRISQREFINLYKMNRAYRKDAPAMYCPECQTGISQVELVDKEIPSFFNDIVFNCNGEKIIIATTRPELLPACVAVFYHPEDERYKHLKGEKAKVPLFDFDVPILEDSRVDPEKGTGIVMCCTFGDQTDMEWQKAYNLPIKQAITPEGKMSDICGKYAGYPIKVAREMMIEDMKNQGLLVQQKPIRHMVNVHERCGTEIEFIKSKQWFIKYLDLKDKMLEWGNKLKWHPEHMKNRYDNWVKGLQWDWLISRQRYFGVPFPVWYCEKCDEIILADINQLPVDPLKDKPRIEKCPRCGHNKFIPEKDVLDTWATSSLTPRLAIELMPEKYWKKLFPMTLRPQAHDIITFWLFNTAFRSNIHYNTNPWEHCMISGFVLDPHGKKMSKSKGNIVTPQEMMQKYSADCLRYWASSVKLGEDVPFQEKEFVAGKKLMTKFWNACKFSMIHLKDYDGKEPEKLEAFDLWILTKLNKLIKSATEAFENFEYSKAKAETEIFFWQLLCDNYLEIIKDRMYNPSVRGLDAKKSAMFALYKCMLDTIKLFSPIIPYFAEEIYHLYFVKYEKKMSIHISDWPLSDARFIDEKIEKAGDNAILIISAVRKFKAEKKVSLKQEVKELIIDLKDKDSLKPFLEDIKAVTCAREIKFSENNGIKINSDIKLEIVI